MSEPFTGINFLKKPRLVLLDSSGTLVNDSIATFLGFRKIFKLYGRSLSFREFKEEFCLPCSHFLARKGLPNSVFNDFLEMFNTFYLDSIGYIKPFPDVKECLQKLIDRGIKVGLVSATPTETLMATLKRFNLLDCFDTVVGDAQKPSPTPIFQACKEMGEKPSKRVIYIGDMEEDIICAKRAGVTAIGISRPNGGYHEQYKLMMQSPRYLVKDFHELLGLL